MRITLSKIYFGFIFLTFLSIAHPAFARYRNVAEFYSNVVVIAQSSIGMTSVPSLGSRHFTSDCIGFVRYVYKKAGIDIVKAYAHGHRGVDSLYNGLKHYQFVYSGKDQDPLPGDLVFFDNTYDVNHNGVWDDPLSHIGIVESVTKHHTIRYIHFSNSGIKRSSMNLQYPQTYAFRTKSGKLYVVNDFLRRRKNTARSKRDYLSSSLFCAFAHIKVRFRSH